MIFTLIDDNLGSEDGLLAGNESDVETLDVIEMINLLKRGELTSTGAIHIPDYRGPKVRNVKGSTPDRRDVDGNEKLSWKQLLITISGKNKGNITEKSTCYADAPSPQPDKCTHNQFRVGGHMTTLADGNAWVDPVAKDRRCYLIPWCSWHNSTYRDDLEHDITGCEVLELTGYDGKLITALTFMARLAIEKEQIVFLLKKQNGWEISYFDHENDFQNQCHIAANKNYPFVAFKKGPTS